MRGKRREIITVEEKGDIIMSNIKHIIAKTEQSKMINQLIECYGDTVIFHRIETYPIQTLSFKNAYTCRYEKMSDITDFLNECQDVDTIFIQMDDSLSCANYFETIEKMLCEYIGIVGFKIYVFWRK